MEVPVVGRRGFVVFDTEGKQYGGYSERISRSSFRSRNFLIVKTFIYSYLLS